MGKLSELRKVFNKQKKEPMNAEEQTDEENPSMTEGEKPVVHKLKNWIVFSIAGIIIVAFLSSMYFSMGDDSKPKERKQDVKVAEQKNQSANKETDYEDVLNKKNLKTYDMQKTQGNVAQRNINKTAAVTRSAEGNAVDNYQTYQPAAARYSAQVYQPAATYSPAMIAAAPLIQQSQAASGESRKKDVVDTLKSAIRFAIGDSNSTAETSAQSAVRNTIATGSEGMNNTPVFTGASNNVIQPGTLIPAVLITGINTDVNGQAIAQAESDVYDSVTGTNLLIPAGSRFIGTYSGGASNGQSRVNITWNTLLLPNGGSYTLSPNTLIAVDGVGYAGIEGNVNNHTSKMLSSGAISSALGALASVAAGNTSSSSSTYSAGQLAAQGASSNLMNAASSLFQKNINIQPTITVDPGYEFNIFISTPIALNAY